VRKLRRSEANSRNFFLCAHVRDLLDLPLNLRNLRIPGTRTWGQLRKPRHRRPWGTVCQARRDQHRDVEKGPEVRDISGTGRNDKLQVIVDTRNYGTDDMNNGLESRCSTEPIPRQRHYSATHACRNGECRRFWILLQRGNERLPQRFGVSYLGFVVHNLDFYREPQAAALCFL
jgi:hypothetical protein